MTEKSITGELINVNATAGKLTIRDSEGKTHSLVLIDPRYWDRGGSARAYRAALRVEKTMLGRRVTAHAEYDNAFGWTVFGGSKIKLAKGQGRSASGKMASRAATNRLPLVQVPSGYRFEFSGKRNWQSSSDEKWDTVVGSAETGRKLGERRIDGASCVVVRVNGGRIVAVTKQSIR